MPLTYVTITGTFDDGSGTAMSGTVTFTPSQPVYASGVPLVTPAAPVTAKITGGSLVNASGGALTLLATDNAGLATESATGFWYWTVSFGIAGMQGFSFFLPSSPGTVDLLHLANTGTTTGGGVQLDTTASHIQPLGVQAAGAQGLAADSKHVHPWQPYQYLPETYGAKGDGHIINDAAIAGGALTTLTSASAPFTSADTGKTIMINGGQGNHAQPLITTITYVSATTVTLGASASGGISGASAIYGTDDTAAFRSMMTAIGTAATAAGATYCAQVILGNKFYCLATNPAVSSGIAGSTTCQVPLPKPAVNGSTQKLVIDIIGTAPADANMYFEATVPNIQGSALVSMCIPPYVSGTNPYPSILGLEYDFLGSLTGGFANVYAYVDGVTAVIPYLGPQGGWDFRFCASAGGGSFSAMAFGAILGTYNNLPDLNGLSGQQNNSSNALYMPLTGNNAACTVRSFANQGFTFGVTVTEHCAFQRLDSVYDIVGIQCVGGGAHGNWVGYACVEACFSAVQYTGSSAFPLIIDYLDTETITTWHIQDTQNALYGRVLVHTNSGAAPAVLAASNCEIIYESGTRTVSGAPSYTLGTAFQNPWWKHSWVQLAGGTVTNVQIGPTSATCTTSLATSVPALPGVQFKLPSGWWLNITGSVKPTTFNAVPD